MFYFYSDLVNIDFVTWQPPTSEGAPPQVGALRISKNAGIPAGLPFRSSATPAHAARRARRTAYPDVRAAPQFFRSCL